MDCFGAKDCASNFRCVGGFCVEITEPLNPFNNVAGCGGTLDSRLPEGWENPTDWERCGNFRELGPGGEILEVSAGPCREGTVCLGGYCQPDWNDFNGEFDWDSFDPEDPSTFPWDPEDPSTYPDRDENGFPNAISSCGTPAVPVLPPPPKFSLIEPGDANSSVETPNAPEFEPPEFPEIGPPPSIPGEDTPRNYPKAPPVVLSCDDEPNCGTGRPGFEFPSDFEFPEQYEAPEFPEVEFDLGDPETWPEDDEEFDPADRSTYPEVQQSFTDVPIGVGACATTCPEGLFLLDGKCQERPCSKYCSELYLTDPKALLDEGSRCGAGSYCTGTCEECAQVPGRPAPGPLLYDKGFCVSKARADFPDANGDGLPDEAYEPGDDDNPLPYGGVHCKCLKDEEIPECWKCDDDGIIRPSPRDCSICTSVDGWECSCGVKLDMQICRRGNEAPVSAEAIRVRLAARCQELCTPEEESECNPDCVIRTYTNPPWEIGNAPCPKGFKCSVLAVITTDDGGRSVITRECDYSELPVRCQCNSVECACHSECGRCEVCNEEGKCIKDPAAPPECCDPRDKRVKVLFRVTEDRYAATSCDGVEIRPSVRTYKNYEFDRTGVGEFTLPPEGGETVVFDQTCDSVEPCLNLNRFQAGKIEYDAHLEDGTIEKRNWYVGEYYEGNCRATFNRVIVSRIEMVGEPVITCTT